MHCFSKIQLYITFTQELDKYQLIILYSLKNHKKSSDIGKQDKKLNTINQSSVLCLSDNWGTIDLLVYEFLNTRIWEFMKHLGNI